MYQSTLMNVLSCPTYQNTLETTSEQKFLPNPKHGKYRKIITTCTKTSHNIQQAAGKLTKCEQEN